MNRKRHDILAKTPAHLETLYELAKAHGVTVDEVVAAGLAGEATPKLFEAPAAAHEAAGEAEKRHHGLFDRLDPLDWKLDTSHADALAAADKAAELEAERLAAKRKEVARLEAEAKAAAEVERVRREAAEEAKATATTRETKPTKVSKVFDPTGLA